MNSQEEADIKMRLERALADMPAFHDKIEKLNQTDREELRNLLGLMVRDGHPVAEEFWDEMIAIER